MSVPAVLRYTQEHVWVSMEGGTATIGLTDYSTQALVDVVYVSLPEVGVALTAGEPCGEVESTKSVSDPYSTVESQDQRPEARARVQHVLRLSTK
jgi:glycine cleavage system H protein